MIVFEKKDMFGEKDKLNHKLHKLMLKLQAEACWWGVSVAELVASSCPRRRNGVAEMKAWHSLAKKGFDIHLHSRCVAMCCFSP